MNQERIKGWNSLNREEKIRHFFENPEEIRDELAKELWGPEAKYWSELNMTFPVGTSWCEIAEIIKKTRSSQWVCINLTEEYFQPLPSDTADTTGRPPVIPFDREINPDYYTFQNWKREVLSQRKPVKLSFRIYDDTRLYCNECIKDGGRGDSDGFGVEDSLWACMLINLNGTIELPFRIGEIWPRQGY